MHLYNAWLPPPVVEETKKEKDSFRTVLNSVKNSYKPDDPDSVYSTLKWISVLELLVSPPLSLSISLITSEFSALFDSN
jgi:proteasome activator subunit 4